MVPAKAKQRKGIKIFHFRPMLLILLISSRLINLTSLRSSMGIMEYWSTAVLGLKVFYHFFWLITPTLQYSSTPSEGLREDYLMCKGDSHVLQEWHFWHITHDFSLSLFHISTWMDWRPFSRIGKNGCQQRRL